MTDIILPPLPKELEIQGPSLKMAIKAYASLAVALRDKDTSLCYDAFGAPRTRYVRITLDGCHCIMHPSEGDTYVSDAIANGDNSEYVVSDVYLSEREFDSLGEFDGF